MTNIASATCENQAEPNLLRFCLRGTHDARVIYDLMLFEASSYVTVFLRK